LRPITAIRRNRAFYESERSLSVAHSTVRSGRRQARLFLNVERAYREFRHEPADEPRDWAKAFDAIYRVAKVRGLKVE
jgi:hypothetical protein